MTSDLESARWTKSWPCGVRTILMLLWLLWFSGSLLDSCLARRAGSSFIRFRWFRRQEWKGLPSVPTPHASRWIMDIKSLVMTQRCQEGCQGHAMHTCSFQNIGKEHIFLSCHSDDCFQNLWFTINHIFVATFFSSVFCQTVFCFPLYGVLFKAAKVLTWGWPSPRKPPNCRREMEKLPNQINWIPPI